MNVTVKRPAAKTVTIELDEEEAGFLRCILGSHPCLPGFSRDLFMELNKYTFSKYEIRYPDWKKKLTWLTDEN